MVIPQPTVTLTSLDRNRREISDALVNRPLQRASQAHSNHQLREENENRASGANPKLTLIRRGRTTLIRSPISKSKENF